MGDARFGSADGRAVQLRELRAAGAGRSSAAGDPAGRRCRPGGADGRVPAALRAERAALDPAGEAAARLAAAGVLLGALRAPADGAAGLQPAVPLVRRPGRRRPGVGRDGVHQEPRPAARGRDRGQVPARRARAAEGRGAAVGRALLGRRHADPGLGLDEELPAEGRQRRAAGAGPQRRARLPRREAQQRHPRLDHRPRGQALPQGQRQGGQALASWAMR